MQAQDVMTCPVITVEPDATVESVARLLLDKGISAVPVVDAAGNLSGIVSEADLVYRPETGTVQRGRWWLELFRDGARLASDYAKTHGTRARDVMQAKVVHVPPDADLLDVLALMERHAVRRVLVIEGERLAGILTRSGILRGLLASRGGAAVDSSDRGIRLKVLDELAGQLWVTLPRNGITVSDGVVGLWGEVASPEERQALRIAAERVPGVKGVEDHTTLRSPQLGREYQGS